jgi:hypothetical protein
MSVIISRHARRQMKWRKISEAEVKASMTDPDMIQDAIKERKNELKTLDGRLVKITYCHEGDDIIIITAVIKRNKP